MHFLSTVLIFLSSTFGIALQVSNMIYEQKGESKNAYVTIVT